MRIETISGERSLSFKLRDIVLIQIQLMFPVRDANPITPSYDHEEFCNNCLKFISRTYGDGNKFNKQNLKKPSWDRFKRSINHLYHDIKRRDPNLWSYLSENKGWIKIKLDEDSPKIVFKDVTRLSKDRVVKLARGHNTKVTEGKKAINYEGETNLLPDYQE